ncbi:MAG: hypothetical protein IPK31_14765 [Chitinophagaceae bacterium]|nr:hypothetical protein [Chitinophagaceae bacterium]
MRKNLLFTSFYILCSLAVDAQTAVSDSLLKLLPAAKEDTSKVNYISKLPMSMKIMNLKQPGNITGKLFSIKQKIKDRNWYYKSLSRIGNTFLIQGNTGFNAFSEQALAHCQRIE